MKTTLLVSFAVFATCSAFTAAAQYAQVILDNNICLRCVNAPVYGPEPANPYLSKIGNTPAGYPPGTQTYGGPLLGHYPGSNYAGAALRSAGYGLPDSSLWAITPVTTFGTGSSAGLFHPDHCHIAVPGEWTVTHPSGPRLG